MVLWQLPTSSSIDEILIYIGKILSPYTSDLLPASSPAPNSAFNEIPENKELAGPPELLINSQNARGKAFNRKLIAELSRCSW